jgi:hypothetical protein
VAFGGRYRGCMDRSITRRGSTGRPNAELAEAVGLALVVLEEQGARAAADYLTKRGAGFALTCRVLAEPARRRVPPVDGECSS